MAWQAYRLEFPVPVPTGPVAVLSVIRLTCAVETNETNTGGATMKAEQRTGRTKTDEAIQERQERQESQGNTRVRLTLGVDTHADQHVIAALDQQGRLIGSRAIPTTPAGFAALRAWATERGKVECVGIEGAGNYGVGLARWLRARGVDVVEVDRPDRRTRRQRGTSDPVDAEAAARAVLAGTATGQPKTADGRVEAIRALRLARRSAIKARTQAANQLHALVVTAPEGLRSTLRPLHLPTLVTTAARLRPPPCPRTPEAATKVALKSVARRSQTLTEEIAALDRQLVYFF